MNTIESLLQEIPPKYHLYLNDVEGENKALNELQNDYFNSKNRHQYTENQRVWECIALYFFHTNRPFQAITIIKQLYWSILNYQISENKLVHKGMPLVWLYEFYRQVKYIWLSRKYMFLTCVEDAIRDSGSFKRDSGVYPRLSYHLGMNNDEINELGQKLYEIYQKNPQTVTYPEYYLQIYGDAWKTTLTSVEEQSIWDLNRYYFRQLLTNIGDNTGKSLEDLAEYLLMCLPGARVKKRVKTHSSDIDVLCTLDGFFYDFRMELGRYIICECKNWKKKANFTTVAKFMRVLDSAKCKTGILFSKRGISGTKRRKDAEIEIIKYFHEREKIVIVISEQDLMRIASGESFISILRDKYENIKFDLYSNTKPIIRRNVSSRKGKDESLAKKP